MFGPPSALPAAGGRGAAAAVCGIARARRGAPRAARAPPFTATARASFHSASADAAPPKLPGGLRTRPQPRGRRSALGRSRRAVALAPRHLEVVGVDAEASRLVSGDACVRGGWATSVTRKSRTRSGARAGGSRRRSRRPRESDGVEISPGSFFVPGDRVGQVEHGETNRVVSIDREG